MENQGMSSGCDLTVHQPYTPEHNPFVAFSDIVNSPTRCSNIVLANPTGCSVTDCVLINDLSSASSVSFGDGYLKSLIPNILSSATFTTQRSALFVVFDEGNGFCPLNGSG